VIARREQLTSWGGRLFGAVRPDSRGLGRKDGRPVLYLIPALGVYAAFFLWPTWQMVRLSFFNWDGVTVGSVAGIANYTRMTSDPLFWTALTNTASWTAAAIVVPVMVGLALAILLSRTPMFGKTIFRTLFFLPQVLSTVVVAVLWRWIYNPSYGALNTTLDALGLGFLAQGWLGSSALALPALFIAWSWTHYGFVMVVFMAAIDDIDETYFDAAAVDGANLWQQIRHVLVPAIRGPMTTVVLITAVAAFQIFDLVYLLTNGGPARSTSVLAHFMFQAAFHFRRVGYGATIGVALMIIILAMSLILIRARRGFQEEA
jgi:raffinose/stachyose/melibiose transport system permease protein